MIPHFTQLLALSAYCCWHVVFLLDTNLIVTSLGNVSHPSLRMVSRLVVHSQESNVHTTCCKHGNLELHIDGRSVPWLRTDRGHEVDFGIDVTLCLSWETLDTPYNSLLFGFVFGSSKQGLDLGLGSILGDGDLDHNVSRKELVRKVGNDLEIDGNSRMSMFLLYRRNESKGHIDIVCHTVSHQLKFTIWWNKGNGTIGVKLSQTNTTMKGTVINFNTRFALSRIFPLNHQLVIQTKLALGHARQLGIHLNLTRHFVSQDTSRRRQQEIDAFQDVNVYFISLVLDTLTSPINSSGNLTRQLRWLRLILWLDIAQVNVETQHVNSTILRISKVHCLIHQFIN
mmetsp:Transcript_12864/g.21348  ORF Transcript_12864/g.21348 Transcript_12864/m.21348 type:complete len:341 (+) Transcript_12864:43-1065(+)